MTTHEAAIAVLLGAIWAHLCRVPLALVHQRWGGVFLFPGPLMEALR